MLTWEACFRTPFIFIRLQENKCTDIKVEHIIRWKHSSFMRERVYNPHLWEVWFYKNVGIRPEPHYVG